MVLKPGKIYWKNIGHSYESYCGRFKIYEVFFDNISTYKLIDYKLNEFVSKPSISECFEEAECRSYEEVIEES